MLVGGGGMPVATRTVLSLLCLSTVTAGLEGLEGLESSPGCGSLLSNESQAGALAVSVWEVYSDTAVLDWYITLQHKFR